MQILGLLSMYFNAVVVFVKENALSVLSGKGSCLKKGGGGRYIMNEFLNQISLLISLKQQHVYNVFKVYQSNLTLFT